LHKFQSAFYRVAALATLMSTTDETDWYFSYRLSNKVTYSNIVSSNRITFNTEKDSQGDWVTSFDIFVPRSTEDRARVISGRKARRIAQIITLLVGLPITVHYTGSRMKKLSGPGWTVTKSMESSYNIAENLDLDVTDSQIANIIHQDDALAERFHHAYWGLRAAQDRNYEGMIIQFYQAIERVLPQQAAPYKALRDMLSHPEQPFATTKKALDDSFPNDRFEYTTNGQFDYNSSKNFQLLVSKAGELQKLARDYLKKELGK
jgi:hypothetical protein